MINKVQEISNNDFSGGLNTISNIFNIKQGESPNCMNVNFLYGGALEKTMGIVRLNAIALASTAGWGSFDYGGIQGRWVVVGANTGLYGSLDLGATFTDITSGGLARTAGLMYFERSKTYLISTTENYDTPLYWAGSSTTYMAKLSTAATACKYAVSYFGYLFLLNSAVDKRVVYYEDENTMINGAWTNTFSLPSSKDDEICGAIVYKKYLYISTKHKIFRIGYVGGNPDFDYVEVKNWGFIDRTMKKVTLADLGEVVIGLCWDRRVRIFDGSADKTMSSKIENDNKMCEFALENIPDSQLKYSHGVHDTNRNFYKLAVAMAPSSCITHIACLNLENNAWFPYNYEQKVMSMVMAESGNESSLLLFNYNGLCFKSDTSNSVVIGNGYTSEYPTQDANHVKATTSYAGGSLNPYFATDSTKSLTGDAAGNAWGSDQNIITNQRFHIDLGSAKTIERIYYENGHHKGSLTNRSVKNFTFWGSNSATAFAELTYATDTDWTQLTTSVSEMDIHITADTADPKYITVTNATPYRYYAFKFADNWGNIEVMSVRRIELQTENVLGINDYFDSPFLISKTPNMLNKAQKINCFFDTTSSNNLNLYTRTDFSSVWNFADTINITTATSSLQIKKSINLPIDFNVFQYRITSDRNKAEPWLLNRADVIAGDYGIGEA